MGSARAWGSPRTEGGWIGSPRSTSSRSNPEIMRDCSINGATLRVRAGLFHYERPEFLESSLGMRSLLSNDPTSAHNFLENKANLAIPQPEPAPLMLQSRFLEVYTGVPRCRSPD